MKPLKQIWKALKAYPLVFLFLGFLLVFSAADAIAPSQEIAPLDNRVLAQPPAFSADALLSNKWTADTSRSLQDQLLLRDSWVSLYSMLETAQGKLENNGIWYADDGYQIAKNSFLTSSQQQKLPINTAAVCQLAQRHPGQVSVMIVPSPANILQQKLRWCPPQTDENSLLDSIFAQVEEAGGTAIDLRNTFNAHSGQPLYYRTDHHWTTDGGAWLAYTDFCAVRGLEALPPEANKVEVPGFLGTSFAKTRRFGTQPDTLVYYDIPNPLLVYNAQSDGSYAEQNGPVMQAEKLETAEKYSAFLRGNNGYSVLQGNGKGSILVIKDSYGNCFVPYLAQNYATIGIIDLRAWMSVDSTFAEGQYDEILVVYSFEPFSKDMYANRMGTALQK